MKHINPTSPGRRNMSVLDYKKEGVSPAHPYKPLVTRLKTHAGRNHHGTITMRHQGGGNKKLYRLLDFKQDKYEVPGIVEAIEYDPYRTSFIMRMHYRDGERRYILAPQELKVGDEVVQSKEAPLKTGNRTVLKRIPVGTSVYNVELQPGKGGQIGRSAGSSIHILAHEEKYTHLKMPSGEIRKVLGDNFASIGQVSNPENNLVIIGKAGRSRGLGIRPTVRGKVMNPVDHPYGGGEGKTQRGTKRPKDIWGNITGGRKTRNKKKWSSKFIIQRRKK